MLVDLRQLYDTEIFTTTVVRINKTKVGQTIHQSVNVSQLTTECSRGVMMTSDCTVLGIAAILMFLILLIISMAGG